MHFFSLLICRAYSQKHNERKQATISQEHIREQRANLETDTLFVLISNNNQ